MRARESYHREKWLNTGPRAARGDQPIRGGSTGGPERSRGSLTQQLSGVVIQQPAAVPAIVLVLRQTGRGFGVIRLAEIKLAVVGVV